MPYNPRRKMNNRRRAPLRRKAPAKLATKTALAVKKIVNSQMNKVIETKHCDYIFEPVPLSCFYHNVWYNFESDPLTVNQGVQDSQALNPVNRIGDSIFAKGIMFKILFTNFNNWPNNHIRILVLKCKAGSSGITNPTFHAQLTNNLIQPVYVEDARIRGVVYDKTFSVMSTDSAQSPNGVDKTWMWKHYVKINKKIKYDEGGSGSGNDTYRCYALMYSTQGTFTTTNIGRFTYYRRTYFQDA